MARYSTSDQVRGIVSEIGYGWVRERSFGKETGRWVRNDEWGSRFVLEKRTRNPKDGTTDTGWYLYDNHGGGFFGEWCGSRILDAVDEANRLIDTNS
jgi:hypothetical protein